MSGYDIASYRDVGAPQGNPKFRTALDLAATRGAKFIVIGGGIFGMESNDASLCRLEEDLSLIVDVPVRYEAGLLQDKLVDMGVESVWVVHRFGELGEERIARLFPHCDVHGETMLGGPAENIRAPLESRDRELALRLPRIKESDVDAVVLLGGTWPEVLHLNDIAQSVEKPVFNNVTCPIEYLGARARRVMQ